MVLQLDALEEL